MTAPIEPTEDRFNGLRTVDDLETASAWYADVLGVIENSLFQPTA